MRDGIRRQRRRQRQREGASACCREIKNSTRPSLPRLEWLIIIVSSCTLRRYVFILITAALRVQSLVLGDEVLSLWKQSTHFPLKVVYDPCISPSSFRLSCSYSLAPAFSHVPAVRAYKVCFLGSRTSPVGSTLVASQSCQAILWLATSLKFPGLTSPFGHGLQRVCNPRVGLG